MNQKQAKLVLAACIEQMPPRGLYPGLFYVAGELGVTLARFVLGPSEPEERGFGKVSACLTDVAPDWGRAFCFVKHLQILIGKTKPAEVDEAFAAAARAADQGVPTYRIFNDAVADTGSRRLAA